MAAKRSFSNEDTPVRSADYHGSASFESLPPDVLEKPIHTLNVHLTFEEAMRLSLAIQSCLLGLNRYDRRTTKGRRMGLSLSINTKNQGIAVIETSVK